jgi:hypothetical protein
MFFKKKMLRVTSLLAGASVALCFTYQPAKAEEATSGFQGTVNHYGVGMNPESECRHPASGRMPACSQNFHFHFQANVDHDGTIQAPFEITNDSLAGFCGRVHIVVRDRARPPGNILLEKRTNRFCIDGKGRDTGFHERVQHIDFSLPNSPTVGLRGHDLFMEAEDYVDLGVDPIGVIVGSGAIGTILRTIGQVIEIANGVDIPLPAR